MNEKMNVYYIGGSPCSGKSTIAEKIAEKYNLYYFKVDDFLDNFIARGEEKGYEVCTKQSNLSFEQIFMQNPKVLYEEELAIYGEFFEFVKEDMQAICLEKNQKGIIAEGAAFLPKLMEQETIPQNRYISITPTKEFQTEHYKKREWLSHILEGCKDKEKAFENWMDRDALFAENVRNQCEQTGYMSLVTDGTVSSIEMFEMVCKHFGLGKEYK